MVEDGEAVGQIGDLGGGGSGRELVVVDGWEEQKTEKGYWKNGRDGQ